MMGALSKILKVYVLRSRTASPKMRSALSCLKQSSHARTISESQSDSTLWLCNWARAAAALAAGSIELALYSSRFRGVFGVLESSP
jgi:hypothetical protein